MIDHKRAACNPTWEDQQRAVEINDKAILSPVMTALALPQSIEQDWWGWRDWPALAHLGAIIRFSKTVAVCVRIPGPDGMKWDFECTPAGALAADFAQQVAAKYDKALKALTHELA